MRLRRSAIAIWFGVCFGGAPRAHAQPPEHQHEHMNMDMNGSGAWSFMQDGIVFAELNHQGGPRGGDELIAPNWWMGMASRALPRGRLTLTAMFGLDRATVGAEGYGEIFQAGEAFGGRPIVDRQHPHDFFMQLAASWRVPVGDAASVTLSGGPVAEPALGPIAFMHRASAMDNPTAPLGHHTFDSTHVAFGVVTAAVERGRWTVEGSIFNGREPDEHRWNLEIAPLDSVAGRVWFRPEKEWAVQVSTGRLHDPEQLEPGDIERTTASISWTRATAAGVAGVTVGYGQNDTDHGVRRALFAEAARQRGSNTIYGRFESVEIELISPDRPVAAFTIGGVRDLFRRAGFEGGIGADLTLYGVPDALADAYSRRPVSFHLFVRLRPPAGAMGRMVNMRLGEGN